MPALPVGTGAHWRRRPFLTVLLSVFLGLLTLWPPVALLVLVQRNGVNVPFSDEWGTGLGIPLAKWREGTLRPLALLAQHTDSRPVVSRLIALALAATDSPPGGEWDLRRGMAANWVLLLVVSALLFGLLGKGSGEGSRSSRTAPSLTGELPTQLAILVVMNALLFSPVGWEVWLMGEGNIVFLPVLFLLAGLWLDGRPALAARPGTRALAGAAMATAGTFSFSNGLLLWPLLFPWFAGTRREGNGNGKIRPGEPRPWWFSRALYAAAGAAVLTLYFLGYRPSDPAALGYALGHPAAATRYFLTWCAVPLRPAGPPDAGHVLLGAAVVGLFAAGVWTVATDRARDGGGRGDAPLHPAVWPWAALGLFALGSGLLAAAGRTRAGLDTALSSRYAVTATGVLIALVGLGWTLGRHRWPTARGGDRRRPALAFTAALTLGIVGTLYVRAFRRAATEQMPDVREARQKARAALVFIDLLPDNPQLAAIYPDFPTGAPFLQNYFHRLRDAGLVRAPSASPRLAAPLAQPPTAFEPTGGEPVGGSFDVCRPLDGHPDLLLVSGWASDPARPPHEQPAEVVVLTWTALDGASGQPRGEARPFTLVWPGDHGVRRPDVAAALGQPAMVGSGFGTGVFRPFLPTGETFRTMRIAAWAVDAGTGAARRLRGYVDVPTAVGAAAVPAR